MQRQQAQNQQQLEDAGYQMLGVAQDETGRPVYLMKETTKSAVKGVDCILKNASIAVSLANSLKTSLGPCGSDKILVSPDNALTITNDGATIVKSIQVSSEVAKLFVDLSVCQDDSVGDGTTGVVVLSGAMIEAGVELIKQGLHPITVADGYETACKICIEELEKFKRTFNPETEQDLLYKLAHTTLSSKIVKKDIDNYTKISIQAAQADHLEYLKLPAAGISKTQIYDGVIMENAFSHPLMKKEVQAGKVLIASFPLEPPAPKSQFSLSISTADQYAQLLQLRSNYFTKLRQTLQQTKPDLVVCQYGFDDEANSILASFGINALRWVKSSEIERISQMCGGKIVSRIEDATPNCLGTFSECVEELIGTQGVKIVKLANRKDEKKIGGQQTIIISSSNTFLADEVQRSLNDSITIVQKLLENPYYIYGGASAEIALASKLNEQALRCGNVDYFSLKAFAQALESIGIQLAVNSGLNGITAIQKVKREQNEAEKQGQYSQKYGIDCMQVGTDDMDEQGVIETFKSKVQQITLATQVVRMLFKINEVIVDKE